MPVQASFARMSVIAFGPPVHVFLLARIGCASPSRRRLSKKRALVSHLPIAPSFTFFFSGLVTAADREAGMARKPITLDDYHRQGREAAARRNRRSLGLAKTRFALPALNSYLVSRWTAWGLMVGTLLGLASTSPWTPTSAVLHALARRNCASASELGLTPARRGELGYWESNDRDSDGIACEAWPRRQH